MSLILKYLIAVNNTALVHFIFFFLLYIYIYHVHTHTHTVCKFISEMLQFLIITIYWKSPKCLSSSDLLHVNISVHALQNSLFVFVSTC